MGNTGAHLDEQALSLLADPLGFNPEQLPEQTLYNTAATADQIRLAADVVELRLLAHIVERNPIRGADTAAARWLHTRTAHSLAHARAEVTLACRMNEHPPVLAAYAGAHISRRQATKILGFLAYPPKHLNDDHLPGVRERLLRAARTRDPEQLREELERLRQAYSDDIPPAEDHDRNTLFIDELLGRRIIHGDLDAETGAKLTTALSPFMAPRPEPDGTPDRRPAPLRRAEALSDLLDAALAAAHFPTCHGERPRLTVHIPLEDLLRAIPTHTERIAMIRAGDIDAYFAAHPIGWNHAMGPVSLAAAQRLACDCELTMIGADVHGAPLTVHTGERFASKKHRQALADRDRGCAFPHCDRPHHMTQAHHIVFWETRPDTQIDNLVSVCGEHHRAIHHHGWHVAMATNRHPIFQPPPKIDPLQRWLTPAGDYAAEPHAPPTQTNSPAQAA